MSQPKDFDPEDSQWAWIEDELPSPAWAWAGLAFIVATFGIACIVLVFFLGAM